MAQPLSFNQLTVANGLSQSSVTDIKFDKNDFLWAATADGLNRYDGYNFIQYRNSGAKNRRINNTSINILLCDKSRKIWLGGNDCVEVLDPQKNSTTKLLAINCPFNNSNFYYDSGNKKIILFVKEKGIWEFDENTLNSKKVADGDNLICKNFQEVSFVKNQNELQIISRNKSSIILYDLKTHEISEKYLFDKKTDIFLSETNMLPSGNIIFVAKISNKDYLVEYDKAKKSVVRKKEIAKQSGDPFYKSCLYVASINKIIISDYLKGLVFYDTAFNETSTYPVSSVLSARISSANFIKVVEKNNSLWISCDPTGIIYCNLAAPKFAHFKNGTSSIASITKGIFSNTKGDVYSCLLKEGVQIFDKNGNYKNDLEKIGINHEPLQFLGFNTILPAEENEVFINCFNFVGLYNADNKQSNNCEQNLLDEFNQKYGSYTDMFFAAGKISNRIFLVSKFGKLVKIDLRNNAVKISLIDSLSGNISCIYPIDEFRYLIGTDEGLYFFNKGKKIFYQKTKNVLIKNINWDGKNSYWMTTPVGLWQIDKNFIIVKQFTSDDGLANNFCYGTIANGNNLWISTNYGLSKMDLNNYQCTNYTAADGLQSNEFNSGAFWKSEDGLIYFGGVNGITQVNETLANAVFKTNTLITQLKINDKNYSDTVDAWNINNIELDYKQNSIFLEFAGIEQSLSSQITYRYMLEGIDNDWICTGKNRNVRYGGLPSGTYTFKVSCSLNNKDWDNVETIIKIKINPPFWKTWWFIILLSLLVCSLLFYLNQQYNKKKYQKKLEALVVLQKLEDERKRISRDLHDNMGAYTSALLSNLQQLKNTTGENESIVKMKDNADNILGSLRETIWVLNNKSVTVTEFSGGFKNYTFNMLRNFDGIDFDTAENIENNKTISAATAIHLTKILQEAFQNIIKHAGATKVNYSIISKTKLNICIEDNGAGFDINNGTKGNGLDNMEWRAKEAGFKFFIESVNGTGTKIFLEEI